MKLSRYMPLLLAMVSSAHAKIVLFDTIILFGGLPDMGTKEIIFVVLSIMISFVCYYLLLRRGILRTLLATVVINGVFALIGFANKFIPIFLIASIISRSMGERTMFSVSDYIVFLVLIIGLNIAIESIVALPFFSVKQYKNIVYATLIANVLSAAVGVLGFYIIGR